MKYKLFQDLEFDANKAGIGGIRAELHFPNNYGISVIRNQYSYGGNRGLFEAAVLHKDEEGHFDCCYDTPITDDVKGWLTKDDVSDMMLEIQFLPKK